jgi:hypothetical protein
MKITCTLLAFLFCMNAHCQIVHIKNVPKTQKSNLLLEDSSKLMSDFCAYERTRDFLSIYRDSNYSFVSSVSILYYKGQGFLRKEERLNVFDSVCIDFVYDHVLAYKWKEKVKRNKDYWVDLTFIYDDDEKKLYIEAKEFNWLAFKSVFSMEKSCSK